MGKVQKCVVYNVPTYYTGNVNLTHMNKVMCTISTLNMYTLYIIQLIYTLTNVFQ